MANWLAKMKMGGIPESNAPNAAFAAEDDDEE